MNSMTTNLTANGLKLIVFKLNEKEYAIPVGQVKAIEKPLHITRVPRTEPYIKGVINLRGSIIPIIDLKKRFGMGDANYSDSTRMIIVSINGMEVGLIVDSANDVLDIPAEAMEEKPDVVGSVEAEYITGVAKYGKRLLILLSLETVLNPS